MWKKQVRKYRFLRALCVLSQRIPEPGREINAYVVEIAVKKTTYLFVIKCLAKAKLIDSMLS